MTTECYVVSRTCDNIPSKAQGRCIMEEGEARRIAHIIMSHKIVCVRSHNLQVQCWTPLDLICDPRQFFIQGGPEKSRGWTPLPVSELHEDGKLV